MRRHFCKVMALVLMLTLVLGCMPGCAPEPKETATEPEKEPIPVVIQLGSIKNKEQLERRVNEMIKRDFYVTACAHPDVVGCDYLKELADEGFEIMVRLDLASMEEAIYEEELEYARAEKQRMEDCIGKTVLGFYGGSRFNKGDQYAPDILDEIGAKYFLTSARYETLPCYALEPYQEPGHNYIRLPMQSRCVYNVGVDEFDQACLAMSGSN